MIYGQESVFSDDGEAQQFWIDTWSSEQADPPVGWRGVLCAVHGELLVPPRGWMLVDRRDAVPRLFKPRLVVDDTQSVRREVGSATGGLTRPPRRRMSDVPRPQLFSDVDRPLEDRVIEDAPKDTAVEIIEDVAVEVVEEIAVLRDASGSLLRDAFQRASIGRRDPTWELLRPTSSPPTTDSEAK